MSRSAAPLRPGEFSEDDERFMRAALAEAEGALNRWEVPVGCVVVRDGEVVAAGSNRTNELRNVRRRDASSSHVFRLMSHPVTHHGENIVSDGNLGSSLLLVVTRRARGTPSSKPSTRFSSATATTLKPQVRRTKGSPRPSTDGILLLSFRPFVSELRS